MPHAVRGLGLGTFLVFVSSLASAPQAKAQTPAAFVYVQVQGPAGAVYGYSASSSGQLTAISGSPFKPGSRIIGANGSQFFTLGSKLIHSYGVASDGAIGSQLSQVPVFDFSGSSCGGSAQGSAGGAVLDHTGKYIYVLLDPVNCAAYQSYAISSDGSFTFEGDTEEPLTISGADLENYTIGLPSILGNETFAYAEYPNPDYGYEKLIGFRRASSGTLTLVPFVETDPPLNGHFDPHDPDASPTGNYVVVQLNPNGSLPTYLASYTVDSQGNLSTTNTLSNMPTTTLAADFNTEAPLAKHSNSAFSPSGNLFAVYGGAGLSGSALDGIEIYHFNGASPLTLYKKFLSGTPIDQVAWDRSNHLYAISNAQNRMFVFTVTTTSVAQDAWYSIKTPVSLVVVSKSSGATCSAPTSDGINVCSPAEGATVTSPVLINAAASVSGGVYRFELWSGSTKLLSEDSGTMDQTVSLGPGSYKLTFAARNSSGTHEYATRDITVQ